VAFAALLCALGARAAEQRPDDLVRTTAEEVLAIVRSDPAIQAGDNRRIVELAEAKVLPHFDFTRMTRLAMGKNWRKADSTQQETLVSEFRTLLVRTYSVALAQYRNETLEYLPLSMKPEDREVVVRTQVKQRSKEPIDINYRMTKQAEGWKVFDVVIAGVSLVVSYRGTFNDTIEQSGVSGLIKLLQDKNRQSATE
jgi:phospholipid transport system substrate-binding protein